MIFRRFLDFLNPNDVRVGVKVDHFLRDRCPHGVLGFEDCIEFFESTILGLGDEEVNNDCLDTAPYPKITNQ